MASSVLPNELSGDDASTTWREQWNKLYHSQFTSFIKEFVVDGDDSNPKYMKALSESAGESSENSSLLVNFQDIQKMPNGDDLADFVLRFFLNLTPLMDDAISFLARELNPDRLVKSRVKVNWFNAQLVHSVRSLRCELLGTFTSVRGTVTRTSDVRPELLIGDFACDNCGAHVNQVLQQYKYTEPTVCPVKGCGNRNKWHLLPSGCHFGDWQKLKLQENASEIPAGSMPRSMEIILRDSNCDSCKPGDQIVVSGCLVAVPDVPNLMKPGELPKVAEKEGSTGAQYGVQDSAISGLRKLGVRDLSYRLVFLGFNVIVSNAGSGDKWKEEDDVTTNEDMFAGMSNEKKILFETISQSETILSTLIRDVAPAVYGHDDVKKGILLMLTGGVEKTTSRDGIKLRGDLNICVVGDPGVAKSQLLKFVQAFAPRAVYASGKSSTAAGLTASVHRDHDQGDSVIEAGALMLADKGICCIDEFEKMDDKDMIAIHEAMEQQTISISKAGIHATLNARASVLAACNPYNGRYDTSRTFKQNVRLSAPILSRFDLLFVMVDDTEMDEIIARHIVKLHVGGAEASQGHHGSSILREYIRIAKKFQPSLQKESQELLVRAYSTLRHQDTLPGSQRNVRVTVRQLESLVRLSEAIAKLHFSHVVTPAHVSEAYKLFNNSLARVKKGTINLDEDEDDEVVEEGSGNTGERKVVSMDIASLEYMSSLIINYLKTLEESSGALGLCVPKEEIITWYLDKHAQAETEEQLEDEAKKLTLVLNRMIQRDLSLIEEDVEETAGNVVQTVRLHPNFVSNDIGIQSNNAPKHATLTPAFFQASENKESDDLNEKEFLDLIYGTES